MDLSFEPLAVHPEWLVVVINWFESEWPEHFSEHSARALLERECQHDALPMAIVAVMENIPVGTVALRLNGPDGVDAPGPWIGGLYVHPEIRGSGVGRALVNVAVNLAWQLEHREVYAASELRGLFEALGFERIQRSSVNTYRLTKPRSLYERVGGDAEVRRLVDRFYDFMDELPQAAEVRQMHAASLRTSRDKLYKFLSGWMGGPDLYIEQHGHPRLRARHLPFSIGEDARDQWLLCMDAALQETVTDEDLRDELSSSFASIADHMRNRPGR